MQKRCSSFSTPKIALIGCGILKREIESIKASCTSLVSSELLPDSLHDQPTRLHSLLRQAISRAENVPEVDAVVLVYGACGMAVAGLAPGRCRLVVPRAHDCVTLFLGSKERYAACMRSDPSLFWYIPGWCRTRRVPGPDREPTMRAEYSERFDAEQVNALIEMDREGLAHHSRAAYTDIGLPGDDEQLSYTERCMDCLGWSLQKEQGDPSLMSDLLAGKWDERRFLVVRPGEQIAPCAEGDAIIKAVPSTHERV